MKTQRTVDFLQPQNLVHEIPREACPSSALNPPEFSKQKVAHETLSRLKKHVHPILDLWVRLGLQGLNKAVKLEPTCVFHKRADSHRARSCKLGNFAAEIKEKVVVRG